MHCEICDADEAHPLNVYHFAVNLCAIHHRAMFDFVDEERNAPIWIEFQEAWNGIRRAGFPSTTGIDADDATAKRFVEAERACRDALRAWFRKAQGDYQTQNASIEDGGEAT